PDGDGIPNHPLPMVLDVHGGPWARDSWGLNGYHQWLANRGYAVLSGSYGGYATLVGMTYTPEVFACGVDIVGPSSLVTLLQNVPDYWMPFMPVMKVRVGDVNTEEGRAALLRRSPLTYVDKIKRPLLIGQGQ